MGIGTSIFLIAVGAILAFAVEVEVSGVDLAVVGVILMIAGAFGLLLSVVFWNSWGSGGFGPARTTRTTERRIVDDDY